MGRRAAWIGLLALGAALVGVAWKGRELQSEPGMRAFRSAPSAERSAPRTMTAHAEATPDARSRPRVVHEALDAALGDASAKGDRSASALAVAGAALIVESAAPVSVAS